MAWARAVVVLAWATLVGAAHAQEVVRPAADDVTAVRALVAEARYDDAVQAAARILGRTDLSAAQRNDTLEALATAHIAQRDDARAREALVRLYARDPGHAMSDPDASPVVRAAFEAVRAAPPPVIDVRLDHVAPGRDDVLVVSVASGADAVAELRLAYRSPGEAEWARVSMVRRTPDQGRSRLPRGADGALVVEWFVEAAAPSGRVIASLGSATEPMRASLVAHRRVEVLDSPTRPPPRRGGSVLERWWFWTIVGVVVVGGGIAVGVTVAGSSTDPAPAGTLGQRRLQ